MNTYTIARIALGLLAVTTLAACIGVIFPVPV